MSENTVYFVMSTGRCGSSLLMSILANSGANIGRKPDQSWDNRAGANENAKLNRAAYFFDYSEKLRPACFVSPPHMWLRKLLRYLARINFRNSIEPLSYHKSNSPRTAMLAVKYGFAPVIIQIYRHYSGQITSAYQRHGDPLEKLANEYIDINSHVMFLVRSHGGCILSFEDILDRESTEWADALSDATGLERDDLLENRDRQLKQNRISRLHDSSFSYAELDRRLNSAFKALEESKNRVYGNIIKS